MRLYAAYGLPIASATSADSPRNDAGFARFVLVREGFDWLAFFFAPFYAIAHGLWSAALVTLAMLAVAVGVPEILGLDPLSRGLAVLGYAILCGVSAHDVRRIGLEARGYRLLAVISGRDRSHALIRLIERLPSGAAPSAPPPPAPQPPTRPTPALDLGPSPGFWS
jgi:hypothetical protein